MERIRPGTRVLLALSLCAGLLGQAHAQAVEKEPGIEDLPAAISPMTARATPTCDARLETAAEQNSASLFYSAAVCARDKRMEDLSFFLLAGQSRSSVDMALFTPAGEADEQLVAQLWGMIFYSFGGPGDNAILRDKARWDALVSRMQAWHAARPPGYSPGWSSFAQPGQVEYDTAIAQAWLQRKQQLDA